MVLLSSSGTGGVQVTLTRCVKSVRSVKSWLRLFGRGFVFLERLPGFLFFGFGCSGERPADGGATGGGLGLCGQGADGYEGFESCFDAGSLDVSVKEAGDLIPRETVATDFYGFADAVCDGISGRHTEEEGGARVTVVPHG